jgi:hypothetical protein
MSAAPILDALDILFGKRLNPHYEAWRERVVRVTGSMSRSDWCAECGERLFAYYECPKPLCSTESRDWFCQPCFDQHYAVEHNPETHAMEP